MTKLFDNYLDGVDKPMVITTAEPPFEYLKIVEANRSAVSYMTAAFAGPYGAPNVEMPRSVIGINLLDHMGPLAAFYFSRAIQTSSLLGSMPITFRVPGPYKNAPMLNMVVTYIQPGKKRPPGALLEIIPSMSSGLVNIDDAETNRAIARPLIALKAEQFPSSEFIFFSPDFPRLLGYRDPYELAKKTFGELLHPDDFTELARGGLESMMPGWPTFNILRAPGHDGQLLYLATKMVRVIGVHGQPLISARIENVSSVYRTALELNEEAAIYGLMVLQEQKSGETAAHAKNVSNLAVELAKRGGIDSHKRLEAIRVGGLLHDLGKIGVPDIILKKEGKLTDDEWKEMKKHCLYGSLALSKFSGEVFTQAGEIIYGHHLAWDGSGYPDNTSGESIPIECRIMSIADAYDALTSERSYKRPFTVQEAIRTLRSESGKKYDPNLLEIFIQMIEEKLQIQRTKEKSA